VCAVPKVGAHPTKRGICRPNVSLATPQASGLVKGYRAARLETAANAGSTSNWTTAGMVRWSSTGQKTPSCSVSTMEEYAAS
jgi:hypothetical protein